MKNFFRDFIKSFEPKKTTALHDHIVNLLALSAQANEVDDYLSIKTYCLRIMNLIQKEDESINGNP